jgi:hypothetical protein
MTDSGRPSTPPDAPEVVDDPRRRLGGWTVRLLLVSLAGALLEILLVIPVFPAAASDVRGLLALLVDCVSLYVIIGWPFAAVAFVLQRRLAKVALPSASWLLASVTGALVVAAALGFVDRVAASHPAEFPDVMVALSFVARAAVVLAALVSLRPLATSFDALLRTMPKLGNARVVWATCGLAAAVAAVVFAHVELAPVYLVGLAGACGVVFVCAALFAAGLVVAAPRRGIVRASAVACILIVGSTPVRRDDHARFVLFGHVPVAGCFASWLRSAGDFDHDSTGLTWLFGTDCAPFDARRSPTSTDRPGDGVDQDCRGGDAPARAVVSSPGEPWPGCVPPERPSVLLVTIDAFRADRLTADVMPFLASLAQSSTVYARAYAPASMTEASLASIFFGRSMTDLNAASGPMVGDPIGDPFVKGFEAARYVTGAATVYEVPEEIGQSFQQFNWAPRDGSKAGAQGSRLFAATLTDHTLDFFRRAGAQPAFWWVHFPDAHAPYLVPNGSEGASLLARYELGLRYVDRQLARLEDGLVRLGRRSTTIIVVTSDHGEQAGARGRQGHGPHLFEEGIRVPLVIHVPGCKGVLVDEPVSSARLGATLLRLAGIQGSGQTLLPGSEPRDLPVVSEEPLTPIGFKRAVIDGHLKLIVDVQNGGRMLFDLDADPGETQNLARRRPDLAARLEARYQLWLDAAGAR